MLPCFGTSGEAHIFYISCTFRPTSFSSVQFSSVRGFSVGGAVNIFGEGSGFTGSLVVYVYFLVPPFGEYL